MPVASLPYGHHELQVLPKLPWVPPQSSWRFSGIRYITIRSPYIRPSACPACPHSLYPYSMCPPLHARYFSLFSLLAHPSPAGLLCINLHSLVAHPHDQNNNPVKETVVSREPYLSGLFSTRYSLPLASISCYCLSCSFVVVLSPRIGLLMPSIWRASDA